MSSVDTAMPISAARARMLEKKAVSSTSLRPCSVRITSGCPVPPVAARAERDASTLAAQTSAAAAVCTARTRRAARTLTDLP
jgi:hypothetical protein